LQTGDDSFAAFFVRRLAGFVALFHEKSLRGNEPWTRTGPISARGERVARVETKDELAADVHERTGGHANFIRVDPRASVAGCFEQSGR
jgi:hypothetical protein